MRFFGDRQLLNVFVVGTLLMLAGCAVAPTSKPLAPNQATRAIQADQLFDAVLGVVALIPETARTAETLGTRRLGSGVLIDDKGLVLTIGYLIMEAETAAVIGPDGQTVGADIVAFDHESGFGLLRARTPIDAVPMNLGVSKNLAEGTPVLAVSHGGKRETGSVVAARIVARRPFAGYWEYLIEDALFSVPPLKEYGGAALIDGNGHLIGIGSLIVNDAVPSHRPVFGNMFVPVDLLAPVIDELIATGRRSRPGAPWLGVSIDEAEGRVFITRLSMAGPGETAGLEPGDFIIGVNGKRVRGMEDYLRKVRSQGRAGDDIALDVVPRGARDLTIRRVVVPSIDRNDWLR